MVVNPLCPYLLRCFSLEYCSASEVAPPVLYFKDYSVSQLGVNYLGGGGGRL